MRLARRIVPCPIRFLLCFASLLGMVASTGCLVRTRKPTTQPVISRTATLGELTARLQQFDAIKTVKSTVQLQLSYVTNEERLKEFTNVRGFILIRRPNDIRILAQVPVVRSTAFDMSSDGKSFQVHLPTKDRFLVGETGADHPSPKRIENVRPQHILNAYLIQPPGNGEKPLLENTVEGNFAYHVVNLIRNEGDLLKLSRKIWFDRIDLNLVRQQVFDDLGNLATDAWYLQWSEESSIPFPQSVFIRRPKDGYDLQVRVLEPGINEALKDDAFVLNPPPGVKIEKIGEAVTESNGEDSGRD